MPAPRLVLVLSENHTLIPAGDLLGLVDMAVEAEHAGFDAVMMSEHVVLGAGSDHAGRPDNPREYALPGNQDPATPWPSSVVMLGAVAARTTTLRLVAGAIIPPLRHPLLIARELATLDRLSEARLVVQPTVSWHRAEYEALGVDYATRGARLDEHLDAWSRLWRGSPADFEGTYYRFRGVWLEPGPNRPQGPRLWFGGQRVHEALLRRLVRWGDGFNPLGRPPDDDLERLRAAMAEAGRDPAELEMVGGTRGTFTDPGRPAPLDPALDEIPEQIARGFTTICIKPSQFADDVDEIPDLLRRIVEGVTERTR